MRRGNARGTRLPHCFNDSHRQRRPLNRVGTSAQLVKQHQRTRSDLMHNGHDVDHVRGESRQRLLNTLLVSQIHLNVIVQADAGRLVARDMQPSLRHQGKQPQRLERHRLAAGVGTRDDQRIKILPQRQVNGHNLLLVNQRMACLHQIHLPPLGQVRRHALHARGQLPAGKRECEIVDVPVVQPDRIRRIADQRRQLGKDALHLALLPRLKQAYLVVGIHHCHRLNKYGRSGGGGVMDQSLDFILALRLDRNDIPPATHGHDVLLQVLGTAGDHLL